MLCICCYHCNVVILCTEMTDTYSSIAVQHCSAVHCIAEYCSRSSIFELTTLSCCYHCVYIVMLLSYIPTWGRDFQTTAAVLQYIAVRCIALLNIAAVLVFLSYQHCHVVIIVMLLSYIPTWGRGLFTFWQNNEAMSYEPFPLRRREETDHKCMYTCTRIYTRMHMYM